MKQTLRIAAMTSFGVVAALMPLALRAQGTPAPAMTAPASATAAPTTAPLPTPAPGTKPVSVTLPNGLKVVVVEDHAAAVVQTSMWYRFGALDETPGKTGLAHGLEHMMFRGTPSISEGGLDDIAARLGAEENANTANDYTHFYFVMPASKLKLALQIEADRMRNLLLSDHDWQLEKGAVLSEFDGDLGEPTTKLLNDVCLAATPTPLCGLGALGRRTDIVASHASDLRHYYNQYYYPNNATLVIVGDVTPADAFEQARETFMHVAAHSVTRRVHSAPVFASGKSLAERGDYPYTVVDLAYPLAGDNDAEAGSAAILDGVINDQRSPFYANLVVSGLTLGYETSANANLRGGLEHVILLVAPGHTAAEAKTAFTSTMHEMLHAGIPEELISAAKRASAVGAIYARDSVSGLGDRVGYAVGVEGRNDPVEDDQKIADATSADVNAYALKVFAAPLVTGVLTPQRPKPGAKAPATSSAVADNFANRAPSGPVHEASWVTAALAQPVRIESRVRPVRYTLSNGITLLVQPVHENPTVFVSGSIEGSPTFEPPMQTGIRGMVSDLLSYGSERYDFDTQRRISDELGANIELGTGFGAHGLANDLPQMLDVLADGEEHPTFPARYIAVVRQQQLAGIAARANDSDYQARRAFDTLLFASTDPALRESTTASIQSIGAADLHAYAQRYLRPDLTTISVVGDIEPEQAREAVEKAFGSWRNFGAKPNIYAMPIPPPAGLSRHVLASHRLVSVHLGQPAIKRSSPDFVAFNLLNAILGAGGNFDTRLMHEIRERRGLVYGVSSSLQAGRYRGFLTISLSANPSNVPAAVALAEEQLRQLTKTAPTQAEVDRARQRLIAGSLVDEESTDTIVERLDTIGQYALPLDYYATLAQRYNRVTPADILAVAKRYLRPDKLNAVYEGP